MDFDATCNCLETFEELHCLCDQALMYDEYIDITTLSPLLEIEPVSLLHLFDEACHPIVQPVGESFVQELLDMTKKQLETPLEFGDRKLPIKKRKVETIEPEKDEPSTKKIKLDI